MPIAVNVNLSVKTLAGKGLRLVVTGNMYQAFHQIEHLKVDILIVQLKAARIDGLSLLEAAGTASSRCRYRFYNRTEHFRN